MSPPDPEPQLPSPLHQLLDERLGDVRVFLKRDDLIHSELTGNKWRKLKYLLADARRAGSSPLLTFGGAYSNHIRAVAAATLDDEVSSLQRVALGRVLDNWTIDHRFHCGGFARRSPGLDVFLREFATRHGLELDHVYVGKMLLGLFSMVEEGVLAGSTVVAVVTGRVPGESS